MSQLGVPSAKDVAALTKRIDELSAQVAKLGKGTAAKPPAKAATKTATKPATKRAPRKTA